MNILDVIMKSQDGGAVQQLGSRFGLAPAQTQSALAALVPALAAGLQQNAARGGGLDSLMTALSSGGHERYLDQPSALVEASATADGNGILGHVLGSKDVSRQVAQEASRQTGIDAGTLKQMLPIVAGMVMGGLSKSNRTTPAATGDGIMAMLTPLLAQKGAGGVMEKVAGLAGGLLVR